jgi:hypothetical protein
MTASLNWPDRREDRKIIHAPSVWMAFRVTVREFKGIFYNSFMQQILLPGIVWPPADSMHRIAYLARVSDPLSIPLPSGFSIDVAALHGSHPVCRLS